MKWEELLSLLQDEAIFRSSLMRLGSKPANARRALVRWVQSGRLAQLRRSVYLVADPYRKKEPHPFAVANLLKPASYVSLQSALAHHGCIPEHVPSVTSVTTGRPETLHTPIGTFFFRHLHKRFFFGYRAVTMPEGASVFLATPEKALLDLIHLTPHGDTTPFLEELRLERGQTFDPQRLLKIARRMGSARLLRAAQAVLRFL